MSKGKDRIIVQDSTSFAEAAAKLVRSTKSMHIPASEIMDYSKSDPFKGANPVNGISSKHIMSVYNGCTKLWRKCRGLQDRGSYDYGE